MKDDFLASISENLKVLRKRRNLSLEKTAKTCGVSKSMVAQIERCEVNPTITTLGKIADGFEIAVTDLLYRTKPEILFYPKENCRQTHSSDNKMHTSELLGFDTDRRFEHCIIELDIAAGSDIDSSSENTFTFITVFKGSANITIAEKSYNLSSGDMIKFKSNMSYSILNTGKKSCRLSQLVYYPIK